MRVSRVHVDSKLAVGDDVTLGQRQSHYLKHVLRLSTGAAVILFDGRHAVDYHARLNIGKQLSARVESATPVATESRLHSEIIQGLIRPDHLDWMIQKSTECGVNAISIFNAERSQSPLKSTQLEKKLEHWRGVAVSACEQCGRALIPGIAFHADLPAALSAAVGEQRIQLEFDGPALPLQLADVRGPLSILVGPEGGLNSDEMEFARRADFVTARLGPRVMRSETAAVSSLVIAQSILGDLA